MKASVSAWNVARRGGRPRGVRYDVVRTRIRAPRTRPDRYRWSRYEVLFDDGSIADVRLARNYLGRRSATAGVYIDANGRVTYLDRGDAGTSSYVGFEWTSAHSGVRYPDMLTFAITHANIGSLAEEVARDQEIRAVGHRPYYWGAIDVESIEGDHRGHGFVELTGYGKPVFL